MGPKASSSFFSQLAAGWFPPAAFGLYHVAASSLIAKETFASAVLIDASTVTSPFFYICMCRDLEGRDLGEDLNLARGCNVSRRKAKRTNGMATTQEGGGGGGAASVAAAAAAGVRPTVAGAVRHLFHLRDLLQRWNWPITGKPDADDVNTSASTSTCSSSAAPSSPTTPPSRALSSCPSCDLAHEGLIPPDVPEGCLAVYVGDEHRRFVIPASYLAEPAFRAMLEKAAEEFGFKAAGALQLPCEVETFKYILQCMEGRHQQRGQGIVDDTVVPVAAAAVGGEQADPSVSLGDTDSSTSPDPEEQKLHTDRDLTPTAAAPISLEN